MRRFVILWFAGVLALCAVSCKSHTAGAITQQELMQRTQELFDSVAPGDQRPWKKYIAPDACTSTKKAETWTRLRW